MHILIKHSPLITILIKQQFTRVTVISTEERFTAKRYFSLNGKYTRIAAVEACAHIFTSFSLTGYQLNGVTPPSTRPIKTKIIIQTLSQCTVANAMDNNSQSDGTDKVINYWRVLQGTLVQQNTNTQRCGATPSMSITMNCYLSRVKP